MKTDEFIQKISVLVESAKNPVNKRAKNALLHLEMAEKIKDIDPTMSAFRMITAEEEVASAIILALKSKGYAGADKLKHTSHVHKLGMYAFIRIIQKGLSKTIDGHKADILVMSYEGKEIVRIRIIPKNSPDTGLFPIPPLNFSVAIENGPEYDFSEEISAFVDASGVESLLGYIRGQAALRNSLLYAANDGIKVVVPSDGIFAARKERVVMMLCIYLMIDPYMGKQIFVASALKHYIKVLDLLPKELESQF